jgi:hypothetical protein
MATDLLFTRAVTAVSDSIATKDALCAAEFGQTFRAASTNNIASLYRTEFMPGFAGTGAFTTTNYTAVPLGIGSGNGVLSFMSMAGSTGAVACVRLSAALQFTRATTAVSDPVATKDALCVAEFGPTYRAASTNEVASNYRAAFMPGFAGTGAFTTTNYTAVPLGIGSGSGVLSFMSMAGTTGVVPCVSM